MPSLGEISSRLGGRVVGDSSVRIDGVASLHSARQNELAFYESSVYRRALDSCRAGAVLLAQEYRDDSRLPRVVVESSPRLYFSHLARWLNPPPVIAPGVAPGAWVDAQAQVAASAAVAAGTRIAAGAVIGEHCVLGGGCNIGQGVVLGARCAVHDNVTLCAGAILGEECVVQSGAVVGGDGFGFVRDDDGRQIKIPQLGGVRLGRRVEVGVNTAIDRGALDDTVIGDGVKIDNLVQIAHNVEIGDNTVVCGCVGVAGSVKIGANCMIGGGVKISGHLCIGDGAMICGGSTITKNVAVGQTMSSVIPALPARRWWRWLSHMRRWAKEKDAS